MHKLIVTCILVLFALEVAAEAVPEVMAGNPERGETLTTVCVACHGQTGISPSNAFPSIAGQSSKYLLKQLYDIRGGARSVPVMQGMLDGFSDQEMADLAAYYAVQAPPLGAADPAMVELGREIYRAGIPRKQIAACTACHSPTGEGNNFAVFPLLAGQWPEYTILQLKAFRAGERANDGDGAMMRAVARDMSDPEIEAVASYLYGLR